MKTVLDNHHEIQLEGCRYDGNWLIAEVSDLVIGKGGKVNRGQYRYLVRFSRPVAHLVNEEFPAVVADLVKGSDEGFLRILENRELTHALGLDVESFCSVRAYALITAHEVLFVYCAEEPEIDAQDV